MASQPAWRVATYTGGNGNCVEVADAAAAVMVRDTKDRDGKTISIPADACTPGLYSRLLHDLPHVRVRPVVEFSCHSTRPRAR
jgi:Domain of unknown function (DUF397)